MYVYVCIYNARKARNIDGDEKEEQQIYIQYV